MIFPVLFEATYDIVWRCPTAASMFVCMQVTVAPERNSKETENCAKVMVLSSAMETTEDIDNYLAESSASFQTTGSCDGQYKS